MCFVHHMRYIYFFISLFDIVYKSCYILYIIGDSMKHEYYLEESKDVVSYFNSDIKCGLSEKKAINLLKLVQIK